MILTLTRDNPTGPDCTLGYLTLGDFGWQTLERPWISSPDHIGGMPNASCVPLGTYKLVRHNTVKHPHTFALVNPALGVMHNPAPNMRSDVLIHPANTVDQIEGCIALGNTRRWTDQWEITGSRASFDKLMSMLPWVDGEHELVIA